MIGKTLYWFGSMVRDTGVAIERTGLGIQGSYAYKEERKFFDLKSSCIKKEI
jgi:hypothetical protein